MCKFTKIIANKGAFSLFYIGIASERDVGSTPPSLCHNPAPPPLRGGVPNGSQLEKAPFTLKRAFP